MKRLLVIVWAIPLAVLMVSCGGSSDSGSDTPASNGGGAESASAQPTQAAASQPTAAQSGGGTQASATQPPAAAAGGAGTIEAGGRSYAVNRVLRCKPFFEGGQNLDLQALGNGVQLNIAVNTPPGLIEHDLSIQGSPGLFSGVAVSFGGGGWIDDDDKPLSGPPFTRSGDRISGSMTLSDPRGGPNTLAVRFDVQVPPDSQIRDC